MVAQTPKQVKKLLGDKINQRLDAYYHARTLAGLEEVVKAAKEFLAVPPDDFGSAVGDIWATAALAKALGDGVEWKIYPDVENFKAWAEKALTLLESDFAKSANISNFQQFREHAIRQIKMADPKARPRYVQL